VIVVDASALIDALVGEGRATGRLAGEELAAPHLLDAEVGNVIRRKAIAGELDPALGEQALADLAGLEILRYGHVRLLRRAWQLRDVLTVYDALYVALAETLEAPLVTLDARLAATPGTGAVVEVVAPGL
jgi:predicted nucleic acid-binding protein